MERGHQEHEPDAERRAHDERRGEYIVRHYLMSNPDKPLAQDVAAGQITPERAAAYMNEFARDPNTHILRGDYLPQAIAFENDHAREKEKSYTIGLFDIDNFKSYNTELGYETVNELLKIIAQKILRTIRQSDKVSENPAETANEQRQNINGGVGDSTIRYGGEEFIVIFSGSDLEQARHGAERIRLAIEKNEEIQQFLKQHGSANEGVTVSCGLIEHAPSDAEDLKLLIDGANRLLAQAKQSGKNVVFPLPERSTAA